MEKTEKPLKKKKKSKIGFMLFLVIAFALCLIVNYVLSYSNRLETMIARRGSEEDMIETECFIFRNQTVVYSPSDGFVYCAADEDQRVRTGEPVVHVYKKEINAQANKELEDIEKEIKKLSEDSETRNLAVTDVARVEQGILKLMRGVPKIGYDSDFESLVETRDSINKLIEDKRIASGEITPAESTSTLENLRKRKAELESRYNIERDVVYAQTSGAFTSKIDGLESKLSMDALADVSVSYLKNLENDSLQNQSKTNVSKGAAIGKIVDNFKWSIAAIVPFKQVDGIEPGDSIDVRFTDISVDIVDAKVAKIVYDGGEDAVLVMDLQDYVDSIYSASKTNIQIIKRKYEGFRVPAESIRMVDDKTGVYIVKNSKARFIPVDILYSSKEWVIISATAAEGKSTIKLYDEVIISGKNLYDNKVVR